MSVQEIESAITRLQPNEPAELTAWLEEYQAEVWDKQIAQDARAGRFDQLIRRARDQFDAGKCRPI